MYRYRYVYLYIRSLFHFKHDYGDRSRPIIIHGRPGGQTTVFLQFAQLLLYSNFATEFRSYPPLKVIYHPAGFYNSRTSFLWKTHCIIITYSIYAIWTRWIEGRRYNGNAETSFNRLTGTRLSAQVNRNWSDFPSVKSNTSPS